jgi:hypothetical protein
LKKVRGLHHNIRTQEPPKLRIIDSSIHVDQSGKTALPRANQAGKSKNAPVTGSNDNWMRAKPLFQRTKSEEYEQLSFQQSKSHQENP